MPKKEQTFSEDIDLDSLSVKEKGEQIAEEVKEQIEEDSQDTTKTGRQSKKAKDAENTKILIGILEPILLGVESAISSKLPEFKHTEEEIKTLATLGAPVANKYFDLDAIKYQEEARFFSYLFMCEAPKAKKAIARIKKEAQERAEEQEQEGKNEKDLQENGFRTAQEK